MGFRNIQVRFGFQGIATKHCKTSQDMLFGFSCSPSYAKSTTTYTFKGNRNIKSTPQSHNQLQIQCQPNLKITFPNY